MLPRLVSLGLIFTLAATAWAAPPAPPPPEKYNVNVRYRIDALGNQRIRQHDEMTAYLRSVGFVRTDRAIPENEKIDLKYENMLGIIPAAGVPKAIKQRHVRALLIWPEKSNLPAADTLVRVDVYLETGFPPVGQRRVAARTRDALEKLGFVEAFGYDHEKATRLVGGIPAGKLADALEATKYVRVILANPDWDVPSNRTPPRAVPKGQEKFAPELRQLLATGGMASQRLEVVLAQAPEEKSVGWMLPLRDAGAVVEGRVGPLVTVLGVPKTLAPKLAALDQVVGVRLPSKARPAPSLDGKAPPDWSPLRKSGLVKLHAMGKKGKGQRVAVIADDFAGWQDLPGKKMFIDVTALRNRNLDPGPFPTAGKGPGLGTRYAKAVRDAAPEAELVLIRIDPTAPYMLQYVARAINGGGASSALLEQRFRELEEDREKAAEKADQVRLLRLAYLDNPIEDEAGLKRKAEYEKAQKEYDAVEKELRQRIIRWLAINKAIRDVRGVRVVASTLVWADGFPVDGTSALSRYFDDTPFRAALWFQAAGDTGGQAWSGLCRDEDGNGLMELAGPGERLPGSSWSREMAWLAWQSPDGKKAQPPAGTVLRFSLQWKEAHDPVPLKVGEDPYRKPLAKLNLVVVNQPDPEGKARPADDLEVIAQTVGDPIRLEQSLNSATYETTVEVKLPAKGRFAVFLDGKLPDSIHPPGEVSVPASRKKGEVWARIFVDAAPGKGRPIFEGIRTTASLGVPADSRRVLTVGAADPSGAARADSSSGVMGCVLAAKPNLLAYGAGSAEAACFAAGFTASVATAKGGLAPVLEEVRRKPGGLLRLPTKAR